MQTNTLLGSCYSGVVEDAFFFQKKRNLKLVLTKISRLWQPPTFRLRYLLD